MLPEEPFNSGTELIDMVELHLLFVLLRVDPVLLLGIRTFEDSLIFMETVMGKGAPFGNLAIPDILKCFGCRMSGSDILQADLVRRIRSDSYSFLLIGYSVLLRILADHSVKGQIGFIDLGPLTRKNWLFIGLFHKSEKISPIPHRSILAYRCFLG